MKNLKECRICNSVDFNVVFADKTPVADGSYAMSVKNGKKKNLETLTLLNCKKCGFIQLKEIIDNSIYEDYNFSSLNARLIIDWMNTISKSLIKNYKIRNKRVLEIGSGDGSFLKLFKNNKIIGLEPSKKLVEFANKNNTYTIRGYLNDAIIKKVGKNSFDFIIVRHVLEHIDNLSDFVTSISSLLNKDGVIYVESPYMPAILKSNNIFNIFYEHVNYFTFNDIRNLFLKEGIYTIAKGQNAINNGSFYAVLSRKNNSKLKINDRVTRDQVRKFSQEFRLLKNNLKKLKTKLKNIRTAGYGAANKTFRILSLGNFDRKEIAEIYDKNVNLHGKYMPFFNIPIYRPSNIVKYKPEAVIIFATAYQKEITKDLRRLGYGNKIIYLFPTIKIVS